MTHRFAGVLLVGVLVAAGALPARHVRSTRRVPRQHRPVRVAESEAVHLRGHAPGTNTPVGDRHHYQLATVADVRPSVRVGATPALVEVGEAGVVPGLPGQPVPVAANTRPNRPSRVVLSARAPPV